jgi:hypothetical protein
MTAKRFYSSTPTMILELHSDPRPTASPMTSWRAHTGFRAIYRYVEKSKTTSYAARRRFCLFPAKIKSLQQTTVSLVRLRISADRFHTESDVTDEY